VAQGALVSEPARPTAQSTPIGTARVAGNQRHAPSFADRLDAAFVDFDADVLDDGLITALARGRIG
jgi:hypothetical protein